jgi:hypothetical protein
MEELHDNLFETEVSYKYTCFLAICFPKQRCIEVIQKNYNRVIISFRVKILSIIKNLFPTSKKTARLHYKGQLVNAV